MSEAAAEALRRILAQQYALVSQAPMAMAMFDRQMIYLAASRRWIAQYGRGRDDLVGLCHYDLHPDLPDEWKRVHARALAGETLKNEADYWIQTDGTEHWLSWMVYPWPDEDGAVGGIILLVEDITERKLTEAALARSEECLRLALHANNEGVWDWDLRSGRLHLSENIWAITGYPPMETVADWNFIRRVVHPDDQALGKAMLNASIDGKGDFCEFDFRLVFRDGSVRWMLQRSRVVARDESGRALRMVGTITDIDERKTMERELLAHRVLLEDMVASRTEELLRTDHHFKAVLDGVPAMIGYWDKNLRNGFANHAYLDWFGIDPATIPGKHLREVIGEERYALNLPYVEAALRGVRQRFERVIPRPDGLGVRHSIADYIPDVREGVVQGFYVQVTDVTPIKESEVALQESEERFRTLFEEAPIGLALFCPDGPCVMANAALAQIVGATPEAVRACNFRELPAWRSSPLLEKAIAALDTGEPQSYAFDAVTSFGVHRVIECRLMTVQMGGKPHLLVLAHDVSERKRGEAERLAGMERQRDALVREVHHRIKNHLQGVVSLLFERMRTVPELEPLLEPAIADIQTIAKAYGLQSARDDAQVVLGQLVELVAGGLVADTPVACRMPAAGSRRIVAQSLVVPLALVVNELLTNASKHCPGPDQGGGRVDVELEEADDGWARIVIRNHPARLPAGFDFEAGRGLGTGLELVRTLLPRKGVRLGFRQENDEVAVFLELDP